MSYFLHLGLGQLYRYNKSLNSRWRLLCLIIKVGFISWPHFLNLWQFSYNHLDGPIVQQEDAERIPTENPMDGQGNQVLDGEADQHLLQSNVGGVSLGSHVPLPVMIAVQNGNGRNDMINPSMSNMMPQTLRYTNFPPNIIPQYSYANNSTLTYNGDLSNGAGSISLAPVTPSINVNQVYFYHFVNV